MAGLDPAIHVLDDRKKGVDARVKPGHDEGICSYHDRTSMERG
jgi:hypothetical protein